jgi:hypothetical protein
MNRYYRILLPALLLGLGWAIRGHFGHEWGASWAGAMGALAVVLVFNRKDWTGRAPVLASLGAIGWAVGGMMSYGVVIGYCRGTDFFNVAYGYAMLAVIGGLYGFLGGGMLGLGLETTGDKKPDWASLIAQMVAGGWLFWGFLIYQLEWFMTPPRSELWAACLGAAAALAWYLYREGFHRALRVAVYAALGASFGFAFGNFIQTLGAASGIAYNWWNVMEFSLGFCGGLGMAYAVRTTSWPEAIKPSGSANWPALTFIFLAIPLTNFITTFEIEKLNRLAESLNRGDVSNFVTAQRMLGLLIILLFATAAAVLWRRYERRPEKGAVTILPALTFGISLYYLLFGYLVKGFFYRPFSFAHSDTLYVPVLLIAAGWWRLWGRSNVVMELEPANGGLSWKKGAVLLAALWIVILVITAISINAHEGLNGMHERF